MRTTHILTILGLLGLSLAVPVPIKKKEGEMTEAEKKEALKDEPEVLQDWELSLEYGRYLKEVVQALESDPAFRKKLENAKAEDIKSGNIAQELHFVDHNVRTKLDELKRRELERLRHLIAKQQEKAQGIERSNFKIPVHLDHQNPEKFDVEDLRKLIAQTTKDLEEVDKQRRKDFTQYEMQKEFEYKQELEKLSPEERKKLEEKHKAEEKKHKDHPKLHHPGSKQQLEEVWEEQDHMEKDDFDPKTFFYMHDLDGNGVWDETEVKTLFLKELDKMYDPNASEDDLLERNEEMERMREHIFSEADENRDGLISFEEFLTQTKKSDFDVDEGWEGLDEQELYSPHEFEEYQQHRLQELRDAGIHVPDNALPLPHPADLPIHPNALPQYQAQPQGYVVPQNQVPVGYVPANQVQYVPVQPGQVPMTGQVQHVAQIPPGYQGNDMNRQPIAGHEAAPHPGQGVPHGQVPQVPQAQFPQGQLPQGQVPQVPQGQVPQVPQGQVPQVPQGQVPQVPQGQVLQQPGVH